MLSHKRGAHSGWKWCSRLSAGLILGGNGTLAYARGTFWAEMVLSPKRGAHSGWKWRSRLSAVLILDSPRKHHRASEVKSHRV